MLPDRVSNPGPLTYESGALPRLNICVNGKGLDQPAHLCSLIRACAICTHFDPSGTKRKLLTRLYRVIYRNLDCLQGP